jgi:hypothetical protein
MFSTFLTKAKQTGRKPLGVLQFGTLVPADPSRPRTIAAARQVSFPVRPTPFVSLEFRTRFKYKRGQIPHHYSADLFSIPFPALRQLSDSFKFKFHLTRIGIYLYVSLLLLSHKM